ncbi:hypothetical protein M011DRAFT_470936 [Sporormia fimetaria CBS 119925]|uniref:RING-type domain-containing protein n=1 Tax=Sporormia fimetaria CBS 119925 TaxID=1340428 RepID=A0A6A6V0S0_9PLEO|nr:hypothetical protein M011DRAFT_470936 [Sporormia fimetaria CBS 119925]
MSGYEVEHNIPTTTTTTTPTPRRPDLSTFFSTLALVDTSDPSSHHNVHATPQPENTAAVFRLLANALEMMGGDARHGEQQRGGRGDQASGQQATQEDLMGYMLDFLRRNADDPPAEVKGVPDSFLDELERVEKKSLRKEDECPICVNGFLEDKYPLVVQLPCHKSHRFDLECVAPWLKLNSTCPLCREELLKKKEVPKPVVDEEEEEEWDDMYA